MSTEVATEHLFVYGTLAPERSNHAVISDVVGQWRRAFVRGHLKSDGWGASLGYPALIPADDGEKVAGFVLSSAELRQHWSRLDAFEGEGYERVMVEATTQSGQTLMAYVYALRT